jgi:hypothetical protein
LRRPSDKSATPFFEDGHTYARRINTPDAGRGHSRGANVKPVDVLANRNPSSGIAERIPAWPRLSHKTPPQSRLLPDARVNEKPRRHIFRN